MSTTLHTYLCVFSVSAGLALVISQALGFYLIYKVIQGREIETLTFKTPWALAFGLGLLSAGLACW